MSTPLRSESCQHCGRPADVCVCERVVELPTRPRVCVLMHPQEQDMVLGSARLAVQLLPKAELVVGLSWASLAHVVGEGAKPRDWAVLYPSQLPRSLTARELAAPAVLMDRSGKPLKQTAVKGLLVLDGTWSQAKTLWWRNPWLLRMSRIVLNPREASIYGKLRKEPRKQYLSTLESIADALVALGEPPATRETMRRIFRALVQRARDARAKGLLWEEPVESADDDPEVPVEPEV